MGILRYDLNGGMSEMLITSEVDFTGPVGQVQLPDAPLKTPDPVSLSHAGKIDADRFHTLIAKDT